MNFVIKSSSKLYWSFKNNIKLIKIIYISEKQFYIKILLYLRIVVFFFNQLLHNLSTQFFKNLILIRLKGIEANYLYVYQTNFI
jgi:hypothetical protein